MSTIYNCKGRTHDIGGVEQACPELVHAPGAALGVPTGIVVLNKILAKKAVFTELKLTCSRGHTYNYYPTLEPQATGPAPGAFPPLPAPPPPVPPIPPVLDKDYWLGRGHALVDGAYTRLLAQVAEVDKFILWLLGVVPASTAAAAIILTLHRPWHYLVLLSPLPFIFLARWFCTKAQLPGALPFEATNWEECKQVVDAFTGYASTWLRRAKSMTTITVLVTAMAILFATYSQVLQKQAEKDEVLTDLRNELQVLKKRVPPVWAQLRPGKAKAYELTAYVPVQDSVFVSLQAPHFKLDTALLTKNGLVRLPGTRTIDSLDLYTYRITYVDTAGKVMRLKSVRGKE